PPLYPVAGVPGLDIDPERVLQILRCGLTPVKRLRHTKPTLPAGLLEEDDRLVFGLPIGGIGVVHQGELKAIILDHPSSRLRNRPGRIPNEEPVVAAGDDWLVTRSVNVSTWEILGEDLRRSP